METWPTLIEAQTPLDADSFKLIKLEWSREQPSPSLQTKYNYAWGLVKSNERRHVVEGVQLFSEMEANEDKKLECAYCLAIGHYKLGNDLQAKKYTDWILARDAGNAYALTLKQEIESKLTRDGLFGMAIVTALAAAGIMVAAKLFSRR